jgi:uncharacterized protein with PIN domain
MTNEKRCSKCKRTLPIENFGSNRTTKDKKDNWCRECVLTTRRTYYKENPYYVWASTTIRSHKNKGITVLFTVKESEAIAKHTTHCEMCGGDLDFSYGNKGHPINTSPSVDRIYNERVMTLQNIKIVCHRCNTIKGSMQLGEMYSHLEKMLERRVDKNVTR